MGAVITSILEINAVLSVAMDMALRLTDGEVGGLLLEQDGKLEMSVNWGITDHFVHSLIYEDDKDVAQWCFEQRETVTLNDINVTLEEGINLNAVIAAPIQTRDRCLGVALIINKANGSQFSEDDREALSLLASFLAVAIENSRLIGVRLQQQKTAQQMTIARQVQETILPQDLAPIDGAEIGAVYFPAGDVGGDFYDVVKVGERQFMVILGDVSNKGVPAAMVMSACSGIIGSILNTRPDISVAQLANEVNNLLASRIIRDREMFVTLFFARIDLEAGEIAWCNAGHIPGLFWDDEERTVVQLADGGPIIGQFADIEFKQGTRQISSGDRLFLFTDGLTEATDADGNLFGRMRAEQVFTAELGESPHEFCLKVKEWVDRFAQGASEDTYDDFTILQVKAL